ncbi:MAG: hypothetical protein B6U76_04655 [Desulfurococcales archaeon ex4484_217_2]|nr:MAG: hypothetical protein B6U76_04655 [Desulfurococcales archaeon ex4484_217_2]
MVKHYKLGEIKLEQRENYLGKIFSEISVNNTPLGLLRVIIPRGVTARRHYHRKHFEIFVFLKGIGEIIVEQNDIIERIIAKKGDIVIIYPEEKHTVRAVGGNLEIFVIKVPNIPEDKVIA